jgi:hypothetical protein
MNRLATPGSFQKGHAKVGGARKGVPHVKTRAKDTVKAVLDSYNIEPVRAMLALLPKLLPHQQVQVFATLLPYYYPKPQFELNLQTVVNSNPLINLPTDELLKVLQTQKPNDQEPISISN